MGAKALQFITMNASRSGEVRGMTWDELDIEPEKTNFEAATAISRLLRLGLFLRGE